MSSVFKSILISSLFTLSLSAFVKAESDQNSYKALIWNIEKAKSKDWPSVMQSIAQGTDFILIQEAVDSPIMHKTLEPLLEYNRYFESWSNANTSTGLANSSSIPPSTSQSFFSPTNEPIANTPKLVTVETFDLPQETKRLMVINMHAINFRTNSHFRNHVRVVTQSIDEHDGPILFAGDFNTWSKYRKRFLDSFAKSKGLSEALFKRYDRLKLDHIYTRGLNVIKAEQINTIGSDHYPLRIEFNIIQNL